METNPIKNPAPERDSRIINLAAADKARPKNQRVEFDENMQKAMSLLNAKVQLEKSIKDLEDLAFLSPDEESRAPMKKEIADLEKQKNEILENLAALRPEEFATESAFEKMLASEGSKKVREAEKLKNDLEETVSKLKGKLRLLKAEHLEALGKNHDRAHELETQMNQLQMQYLKADKDRLTAWETLATLDKKNFGEQAAFEKLLAKKPETKAQVGLAEDESDMVKNLRSNIGK